MPTTILSPIVTGPVPALGQPALAGNTAVYQQLTAPAPVDQFAPSDARRGFFDSLGASIQTGALGFLWRLLPGSSPTALNKEEKKREIQAGGGVPLSDLIAALTSGREFTEQELIQAVAGGDRWA